MERYRKLAGWMMLWLVCLSAFDSFGQITVLGRTPNDTITTSFFSQQQNAATIIQALNQYAGTNQFSASLAPGGGAGGVNVGAGYNVQAVTNGATVTLSLSNPVANVMFNNVTFGGVVTNTGTNLTQNSAGSTAISGNQISLVGPNGALLTEINDSVQLTGTNGYMATTLSSAYLRMNPGVPPGTTNYYVDSVAGNDANSGRNPASPLQSLTNSVITNLVGPGVCIRIKRGSVFRQQVILTNYGLTVLAYGSGAKPLISGADVLTNSLFTGLAPGCSNTYQIPFGPVSWSSAYEGNGGVTNTNVLMVWDNKTRCGYPTWETGSNTLGAIDGWPGSFLYTNGYVYVHAADNSNPATNGRLYEASTRCNAFVGGDNIYVSDLQAEEAYAQQTSGTGGWAFNALGGGTYNRCEGSRGWDHLLGTTSQVNNSVTLMFANCRGYDCEQGPYQSSGTFLTYKSSLPTGVSNYIVLTNCSAQQPTLYTNSNGQTTGFYAHGVPDTNQYTDVLNCSSINNDIGITIGNQCYRHINGLIVSNCYFAIQVNSNGQAAVNISNALATSSLSQAFQVTFITNTTVSFVNCTNLDSAIAVVMKADTATIGFTNCVFAQQGQSNTCLFAEQGTSNVYSFSNTFENFNTVLDGNGSGTTNFLLGSDYNTYGNNANLAENNPGHYITFANWQAASGQDVHSVSNNISYPADFWGAYLNNPAAPNFALAPGNFPAGDTNGYLTDSGVGTANVVTLANVTNFTGVGSGIAVTHNGPTNIISTTVGGGSVTSVNIAGDSGGVLTFSGGPIIGAGTITTAVATATPTQFGVVEVDNTTIKETAGVLSLASSIAPAIYVPSEFQTNASPAGQIALQPGLTLTNPVVTALTNTGTTVNTRTNGWLGLNMATADGIGALWVTNLQTYGATIIQISNSIFSPGNGATFADVTGFYTVVGSCPTNSINSQSNLFSATGLAEFAVTNGAATLSHLSSIATYGAAATNVLVIPSGPNGIQIGASNGAPTINWTISVFWVAPGATWPYGTP
jgi:hypothetical protein